MTYRMGIDIGGTFTDFAMVDEATGTMVIDKILTTPDNPARAVLTGVVRMLETHKIPVTALREVVHGSTLVTNAVIERRGAATGMLVTAGFADILDIAREQRYDLYDLRLRFPAPIIPRDCRAEVAERLSEDGSVLVAPDLDAVEHSVQTLISEKQIKSLAVCFLHAFMNPAHEQEVATFVRHKFPALHVSASAEVLPFMREYERWTTTGVNAFVQPLVDTYLTGIQTGLQKLGFVGGFYIMTSSGGVVTPELARRYPVRMLESGPAAGVLMAAHVGRALQRSELLSFDMGGTTAKGAIIRKGEASKTYEIEVARVHEFRRGSGLPVKIPVIDMIEIGAGGGGIATIDSMNLLRVGPRSAGADPGPACYGRGGQSATLSDANLLLGYYDPASFLGGRMTIDRSASAGVMAKNIATPLGVSTDRAAWGVHETINEDVARAFRVHASEIGFDYRQCSMIAFGGSGPAHAARIARKLHIPQVIFPRGSGVMSAIGMLVSPLSFQLARTRRIALTALDPAAFAAMFRPLERDATAVLVDAGTDPERIRVRRVLDMRYEGQGYEIEVPIPDTDDVAGLFVTLSPLFEAAYREVFSALLNDDAIEILNWKVEVIGADPDVVPCFKMGKGTDTTTARRGSRPAFFIESGVTDCPVYDRYALLPGKVIEGPALIEENECTCVLGVGDRATLDIAGNLVAEIGVAA
jgi:N-methylhydantoinase A